MKVLIDCVAIKTAMARKQFDTLFTLLIMHQKPHYKTEHERKFYANTKTDRHIAWIFTRTASHTSN